MSATIEKANVFNVGTHNGLTFTADDLDEIVEAFHASDSAGRIPIKLGHVGKDARKDDEPAYGWVEKVWREGNRLYARITDVPDQFAQQIRDGRFRFVSVELLRNARDAAGRTWRWLLDAVAVLGATKPAVSNLQPLSMRCLSLAGERHTFNREETGTRMSEREKQLNERLVNAAWNKAINEGRVLPRERNLFSARHPDASIEEVESFLASTRVGTFARTTPVSTQAGSKATGGRADIALDELAREEMKRARREDDVTLDYEQAVKVVMAQNPDLAETWKYATDPEV